ncbi:MAG: OmpA family protein, partial [Bacteroidetes bacterium]|nr:OmpA family protein [Bacteroidota bacterium]
DGSGNDGSSNDGSGNDGSGNDGSGNDGSNRNGSGNDGSNRNGSGNDGSNRNGSGNDGSNRNGSGNDGSNRNGSGNDGSGDGGITMNFNLKSVESMRTRRDRWGDLLGQRVNNIFFDFAKWDLRPESGFELERLIRFLKSNKDLRIVIAAHTDDIGSDDYNVDLSRKRARSVVEYLVSNGINAQRLEAIGYGESRPEVPNDSEEHRARNRRVEFRIDE